jgi:hypothetical protein
LCFGIVKNSGPPLSKVEIGEQVRAKHQDKAQKGKTDRGGFPVNNE